MQTDRVKALFDEPGCAINQAKSDGARKQGCAGKKALVPGGAAGGCAFDGAKICLQPIADAIHLVHGPAACEGNSWESRHSLSSGPQLFRTGLTTDLSELDIIHGAEDKLMRAIERAIKTYRPQAVFVYATCVSGLIGDDVEAVSARAAARFGVPVVPVNAPGFVGKKNLGNKLGGEALLTHVIGTREPDDVRPTDINILGEYNVAGDFWLVKPLLDHLGIRIRASITGDGRYDAIAKAHRAQLNMVVCSQALITLARKMQERWGIPYFEGSFYGIGDTSDSLRRIALGLVERGAPADLLSRTEALIGAEEQRAWATLETFRPRLAGKRVLLYTGGVKSWSVVAALQEVGLRVVGTSVRKSTDADKDRARERLGDEGELVDAMSAGEMDRRFRAGEVDVLLSGGRTQFAALKARIPWVDVNQERHQAYAGYDGMVNLVRQIDLALHNPVWDQVRAPAPWEAAAPASSDPTAVENGGAA